MVMDFYQKNPSALASLRGTVYEEKIISSIKEKAKSNKKDISKVEAEKILKKSQDQDDLVTKKDKTSPKKVVAKKTEVQKEASKSAKSKTAPKKTKKVSKK